MPASLLDMNPAATSDARTDGTSLLRRFLEAYWLRPENALWMTLRSEALARIAFTHPSIDLGCGDGVFSFLHFGGVFDPAFDVFTAVEKLDRVRDGHADMFDGGVDCYRPLIRFRPNETISLGADCKPAMLARAAKLDFYARLVEHDNNHSLPFDDGAFATVYCNAAYWVREIDLFLAELARIARPGGRIILQVKLDSMRRYTLKGFRSVLGDRFLDIIDRGRMDCWPTLADRPTWENRFVRAGFSILEATSFVSRTHAHLWDIGLRPIAPQLVRMANSLAPAARADIKRDWVDLLCELLSPMCKPMFDLIAGDDEPAEIQYVLCPR